MSDIRNFLRPSCFSSSSERQSRASVSNLLINTLISAVTSGVVPLDLGALASLVGCELPKDYTIVYIYSNYIRVLYEVYRHWNWDIQQLIHYRKYYYVLKKNFTTTNQFPINYLTIVIKKTPMAKCIPKHFHLSFSDLFKQGNTDLLCDFSKQSSCIVLAILSMIS